MRPHTTHTNAGGAVNQSEHGGFFLSGMEVMGMAEYIKLESLLSVVKPDAPDDENKAITISTAKTLIRSLAHRIPAADVAPVRHGKWEWDTEDIYRCSNCAEKSHVKEVMGHPEWAYCPNCGAKMDLE